MVFDNCLALTWWKCLLLAALHVCLAGDELLLLQMVNQRVSRSSVKLTVVRMEVRMEVSGHLTACVLPASDKVVA
jgi:hypothetical protein